MDVWIFMDIKLETEGKVEFQTIDRFSDSLANLQGSNRSYLQIHSLSKLLVRYGSHRGIAAWYHYSVPPEGMHFQNLKRRRQLVDTLKTEMTKGHGDKAWQIGQVAYSMEGTTGRTHCYSCKWRCLPEGGNCGGMYTRTRLWCSDSNGHTPAPGSNHTHLHLSIYK